LQPQAWTARDLSSVDHPALAQGGMLQATAGPPEYKVGPVPPSPAFVYGARGGGL